MEHDRTQNATALLMNAQLKLSPEGLEAFGQALQTKPPESAPVTGRQASAVVLDVELPPAFHPAQMHADLRGAAMASDVSQALLGGADERVDHRRAYRPVQPKGPMRRFGRA